MINGQGGNDHGARFNALFSPANAPGLKIGRIGSVIASGEECKRAEELFTHRQSLFGWRESTADAFVEASGGVPPPTGAVACKPLPFWPGAVLWHFGDVSASVLPRKAARRVTLRNPDRPLHRLTGTSSPIHEINKLVEDKSFDPETGSLQEYLAFFCEHVHGEDGAFALIETETLSGGTIQLVPAAHDLRPGARLNKFEDSIANQVRQGRHLRLEHVKADIAHPQIVRPPEMLSSFSKRDQADEEVCPVIATVLYSDYAFRALLVIDMDGLPIMVEDEVLPDASLEVLVAGWGGPPHNDEKVATSSDELKPGAADLQKRPSDGDEE